VELARPALPSWVAPRAFGDSIDRNRPIEAEPIQFLTDGQAQQPKERAG
jgi:hypothetical protein